MSVSGPRKSQISVIVADDYEPFRRFLCSSLAKDSGLQVISEARDGPEAIRKTEQLRPQLVLLDIGLTTLNGIEAARRILRLDPECKVIFLNQQFTADIVQAAFATGATGFLLKADAGKELLIAAYSVLRGEKFVSSRIAGYDGTRTSDLRTPNAESTHRHSVQFYPDEEFFLDGLTRFVGNSIKAGSAAIVVATELHREKLAPALQAHGVDIGLAIEQGRYISLDAADTLSKFMLNGVPDPARFLKLFGNLIATAANAVKGKQSRVTVFREGAQLLCAQNNVEAAIRVERLSNHLAKTAAADFLCSYSLDSVQGEMNGHIFQQICAEHSAIHSR